MAQILIAHGHPPDAVERYPLCRIEAFAESITHLENIEARRDVVHSFVAAQGDGKYVQKFVKGISVEKKAKKHEQDADDLLSAFRAGFKGLD